MERHVIESSKLTQALRQITYGFYILTAKNGDQIAAGTVNWVSQVSFEPPQVMVAVKKNSRLHEAIPAGNHFALNIVDKEHKHMVSPFFKPTKIEGHQLNGFPYQDGRSGCPLLIDASAFVECRLVQTVSGGDHTVYIGEVVNAGVHEREAVPLVERETDWHYGG